MRRLPSPDAPLLTAEGAIAPSVAASFKRVEVPSHSQAVRLVSSTRRKLAELPALPKQLNSYAAVLVLTASGLSDDEVSVATGFTVEQINILRNQPAYMQLQQYVVEAVQQEAQDEVKSFLKTKAKRAAEKVVALVDSEDDKVALHASKDILDRNGFAPAQKVDVQQQMLTTFRIEVVDKRETVPVIDMELDDGNRS